MKIILLLVLSKVDRTSNNIKLFLKEINKTLVESVSIR